MLEADGGLPSVSVCLEPGDCCVGIVPHPGQEAVFASDGVGGITGRRCVRADRLVQNPFETAAVQASGEQPGQRGHIGRDIVETYRSPERSL